MDDPDYAEKYSKPYQDDQPVRIAKQMVDARHLRGKGGGQVSVGVSGDPASIGGELGVFHYPTEWFEISGGLSGIAGTGARSAFVGPEFRSRLVLPGRVSPFVGVGAFTGINWFDKPAENDGIDNDDDLFVDEPGEKQENMDAFLAVYPEVGAHLWVNGTWRLSGSARYYVNTEGRDADFWFFGLSFGCVGRQEPDDEIELPPPSPVSTAVVERSVANRPETTGSASDHRTPSFLDNYVP